MTDRVASFDPAPSAPARRAASAARAPSGAAAVLALQRRAGNAAVGRVLARTPQSDALKALQATKGYKALSKEERARLDVLIGGGTSLSAHAWPAMQALLDDPATKTDARKTFRKFLSGTAWLNLDARLPGEKRLPAVPMTLEGPVDVRAHPYRSGAADARKCTVKVERTWPDGTKQTFSIPIFAPKSFTSPEPGRVLPSEGDMAKILAELPIQVLSRVKQVDLNPGRNPDDATWEADPKYNPSGGKFWTHMAASADGVVHVYPAFANASPLEIETTLLHETGHGAAGAVWGLDNDDTRWKRWKRARVKDGISVSQYGNSSDNEDFAESWLLFVTAYGTPLEAELRTLIPNRAKLLDDFIQHKAPAPAKTPAKVK